MDDADHEDEEPYYWEAGGDDNVSTSTAVAHNLHFWGTLALAGEAQGGPVCPVCPQCPVLLRSLQAGLPFALKMRPQRQPNEQTFSLPGPRMLSPRRR